jgi:BirA family transcriptional regulator, biotin operon repressor / biotin---[acetyl-CoA-carboxylase] ligase
MRIVRHRLETVDSTRRYVRELEAPDEGTMVVVTADHQTAGYGQYGRPWLSPIGANLLLTLLFLTDQSEGVMEQLASATSRVLQDAGIPVELSAPNDLYVYGKKIGGLIVDATPLGDKQRVAVSLGLNVNMMPVECADIDQPATSLNMETGKFWDLEALLGRILGEFCSPEPAHQAC